MLPPASRSSRCPSPSPFALTELAGAAREGLLALAVGTSLQVMQTLMAEDVAQLVGAKGRHNRHL